MRCPPSRLRGCSLLRRRLSPLAVAIALAAATGFPAATVGAPSAASSREVLKLFAHPSREYSTGPLWVWNDRLTEDEVRGTMRDLAGQQVRQVFVHPRPGLMTPYLSEEWFELWRAALDEAKKLDMNVWIYDENSYPSGFAGGLVPDAMPEARGRGLAIEEAASAPAWSDSLLGVYRITEGGFEDRTAEAREGKAPSSGRYLTARMLRAPDAPWTAGKCYVDLLHPGVTEKFLEITLGAYERELGAELGKRIPGIFTDEPNILPAGGLPWTDGLPAVFEKRRGYSLLEKLPSLTRPVGDWRRVRHDYYRTLLEELITHWGKPYHDACEKLGLELTGHYWEHEWPRCLLIPDNMALYAWHQRPAIDILMNLYEEGVHAQFGNARSVRELSSVANQLGLRRTLCEAYGAGGWDLRLEDMKRIADWLFVLGVNTIDEHLSYVTIRGARKRDHPQSFSYHEPWWEAYHLRATYASRLSAALSQGEQVQPFLVLEPTTTAWLYQADPTQAKRLEEMGERFQKLILSLEMSQVEYDLGSEDILARHGSVSVRRLKVGKRGYRAVVLPPGMENIEASTAKLLEELVGSGGTVIACGDAPSLVDGRLATLAPAPGAMPAGWDRIEPEALPAAMARLASDGFSIRRTPGDRGILFHHRRKLADGELLFLVNTSAEAPSAGSIVTSARGMERWDLETGNAVPFAFRAADRGAEADFELPPCGSLLLFISWERRDPAPQRGAIQRTIAPAGPPAVRRLEPNVLTLDYADVTAGGETLEKAYVYKAGQFAFRKNGMDRNPWDSAVQFHDELISRKFPADSGVKAAYRFTVEKEVPRALFVVVERPDLYTVRLNGTELRAQPGSWWLDRSFGKIDARAAAKVGENVLELSASPFTIYHEIEAAYVLGDFGVRAAESGFVIVPEEELRPGPWNAQLLPFYAAGVAYAESFEVPAPAGRYRVRLGAWKGSVVRVTVNSEAAGWIEAPPYELDVTSRLKAGKNTVEVTVIGTLKNTLGPHHSGPELGAAWPGMFQQGPEKGPPPGEKYATVGYGLQLPFCLVEER